MTTAEPTTQLGTGQVPLVDLDIRSNADLWADPWGHWDLLRESSRFLATDTGVVARTWYAMQYADVYEAMRNPGLFSSRSVTPWEPIEAHRWIPVELDGTEHLACRQLPMPYFTPGAAEGLGPKVRQWCGELIDRFAADGHCDFIGQFGPLFPTYIFMGPFGLPVEQADQFLEWAETLMHTSSTDDPDGAIRAIVTPGRVITTDTEFHGCPMHAGDRANLPLAAAGS
jgi:cytochrome P450